MAGVKAAHDLHAAGKRVVVLEARDRIGGRIHTERTFAPVPIELGAEQIHTDRAETWVLVRAAGLRTVDLNRTRVKLPDGTWRTPEEMGKGWEGINFTDAPRRDESLQAFYERMGLAREAWPYQLRLLEIDNEPAHKWSAEAILNHAAVVHDPAEEVGENDYRVLGGYDQLPRALIEGLDIRLNSPVARIEWEPGHVQVYSRSGEVFSAACAVLTIPVGVWKTRSIAFLPNLPAEKWSAVDALGIADIVKLHFLFDARVLPDDVDSIVDESTIPPVWWDASSGYADFTGQVLVGWAAGDAARALIAAGETEALQMALASLRRTLDNPALTSREARMMQWNDEPFTRGAYTYTPPGAMFARPALAAPLDDTLFFAGEATAAWYSFVHGAYQSGERAAREVLQATRTL